QAGKLKEAASVYVGESIPGIGPVDQALRSYLAWDQPRLDEKRKRDAAIGKQMPVAVGGLTVFALVATAIFGFVVANSIKRPLTATVSHIQDIARGDVSIEIEPEYLSRTDEFGDMSRAVRTMATNLREVLREIGGGVQMLSASSTQLA